MAKLKRNTEKKKKFNLPVYKGSLSLSLSLVRVLFARRKIERREKEEERKRERERERERERGFRAIRQQPLATFRTRIGRKEIGLTGKNILIFMRVATSELIFRR